MAYYQPDENAPTEGIYTMAEFYNLQLRCQNLEKQVAILAAALGVELRPTAKVWHEPQPDVNGVLSLAKPTSLECGVVEKTGGCVVVETVELPEEPTP
jgi:hypothetical protein